MKKFTVVILALIVAASLVGCGTTYKAMRNIHNLKKRTNARLNLQSTPPDLKPYAQYAVTPLAKDLYKVVNQYNINPDDIPAKYMDPATNPEAAKIIEKQIAVAKKSMAKGFKQQGANRAQYIQMMKKVENDMRAPFWLMTELPPGASMGDIKIMKPIVTSTIKTKGGKGVYISFPFGDKDPETVRGELIAALDSFLLKDSGWTKKANLMKGIYKNSIATMNDTIDLQKQVIAENENNPKMKGYVDRTKRDLKKNENMLAYFKKMQAKKISPITMYQYTWNSTGRIQPGKMPSTLSVVLSLHGKEISVNINKMQYE